MLKYGENHGISVNKSHAACYAAISMQTAYLKAHYPTEFYAGLLTSVMDDVEQLAIYINDTKKNNTTVLMPDINSSTVEFSVAGDGELNYGLNSVKRMGKDIAEFIVKERTENGPFMSLYDFISRCPNVNRGAIENLIAVGAFDYTRHNRPSLINNIEACQKSVKIQTKKVVEGQMSLFDLMSEDSSTDFNEPEVVKVDDWNPIEKAMKEKEAAGLFLTIHPLEAVKTPKGAISIKELMVDAQDYAQSDRKVTVCGIITEKKIFFTKKSGEKMAVLRVEDEQGWVKAVVFPRKYSEFGEDFNENDIVSVTGKVNIDDDFEETSVFAEAMENLSLEKTLYLRAPNTVDTVEKARLWKTECVSFFYTTHLFKDKVSGYRIKLVYRDINQEGKKKSLDLGITVSDIEKAEKFAKKEYGAENVVVLEKPNN